MAAIHRFGLILIVLVIGVLIGCLGWVNAMLILTPLFLMWFMNWDERKYRRFLHQQRKHHYDRYVYRK